jgi:hypothetical protein
VRAVEGTAGQIFGGTATSSPTRKTTSEIVESIGGSECLLMGSDYPHAEGVPTRRISARKHWRNLPLAT